MRYAILVSLLFCSPLFAADDPMCASSPANTAAVRALHERTHVALKAAAPAVVRDGAFYLPNDESLTVGYHPNDLLGTSLVFTPRGASSYSVARVPLRYVEPSGEAVRDFQSDNAAVTYDLTQGALPLFGRAIARVQLTAFNAIELDGADEEGAMQFAALDGAVHRGAAISPLIITNRKPRQLAYPRLFVDESADALRVTWRSTAGETFGYDVQAEVRRDGSIVFSYKALREMAWGAPLITRGFDPATAAHRVLTTVNDPVDGVTKPAQFGPMVDVVRAELTRIEERNLVSVRLRLAGAVDGSQLTGDQSLQYDVVVGNTGARLVVTRNGYTIIPFGGDRAITSGAAARIDGDTIELFGTDDLFDTTGPQTLRVTTYLRPSGSSVDRVVATVTFDAPARGIVSDLSAASGELALPIVEPFTLGSLDVYAVWQRIQPQFHLSEANVDALAIYQSFYTDIIFYAGAYSTAGNPQVDGIAPPGYFSATAPREAALLHMNHFTYNYNALTQTASKVILHEFGHRWLYFFRIKQGSSLTFALNPASAHPAGFVSTPSAFPVYGENESSVMGGATFAEQPDGTFKAHASNMGYSWTDLYLMGLAAPEEVPPWFYLANSDPALPSAYWPDEGAVVRAQRTDVKLDQVIAAEGRRNPSTSLAQHKFQVLFTLVTDPGDTATDAQAAQMRALRDLFARNFFTATGHRASVSTDYVTIIRRRAVR
ncbi:MAG TPA: hypothetical protein VF824_19650 [Thermoanaerobaculia bacterium]